MFSIFTTQEKISILHGLGSVISSIVMIVHDMSIYFYYFFFSKISTNSKGFDKIIKVIGHNNL